jgi:ribosome-associated protein
MSEHNRDLPPTGLIELVRACCQALDDKKADDLRVLHIGPKSSVADYFVIATGTSNPHLRALRIALEKVLDERGAEVLGTQADSESGWFVVDAYDIIFHLFTKEMRNRYALETLWRDAREVPLHEVLKAAV